MSLLGFTEL